jgi:hypothetical protein
VVDSAKTQTISRPKKTAKSAKAAKAAKSAAPQAGTPSQEDTQGGPLRHLRRIPPRMWTIAAYGSYLLTAIYVTGRLWVNPAERVLSTNKTDHYQFQWFLSHAAWALTHGENPLLTDQINVPYQVNLMSNTSFLGMAIPLTPVTLLFGPQVSFALAVVLGLSLTAAAWYWVLSRHVVSSRFTAWVGGAFLGFAPGMISQAGGHPNLVAFFTLPFIIWRVICLREPGRSVRNGVILGLLITYQAFLNEEILFLTALGCGMFCVTYALQRWSEVKSSVKPFLAGLGVTTVTAGVLLAYPLSVQFLGPGRYRGLPFDLDRFVTDLASLATFSTESLAGDPLLAQHVSISPTEENAFFGLPLSILIVMIVVWLRRRPVVWALVATGAMFTALAVGPKVTFYGKHTGIPGPLSVLGKIPPFDLATPSRYALGLIPVVGVLLVLACAEVEKLAVRWRDSGLPVRAVWWGMVVAALLPIAPTPLPAVDRPIPKFITSGQWRPYVADGKTLVSVPLSNNLEMQGMQWSAVTGIGFRMPGGYFLGPTSPDNPDAFWEAPVRNTSEKFKDAVRYGAVPVITADDRAKAIEDLKFWRAGVLVLAPAPRKPGTPAPPRDAALRETVTSLIGMQPKQVGGVWIWDVRGITG